MMTDGSYACGERGITYRLVESLSYTPETNLTLCVNIILILKKRKDKKTCKFYIQLSVSWGLFGRNENLSR